MLRLILGIVAGAVAAMLLVMASDGLVPIVAGQAGSATLDLNDATAMRAHFARQPIGALIVLVLGGGVAAFGGSALAARLARRGPWPGWVAAGILLLASVANFVLVPYHPAWVVAAGLALVVAGGCLGARIFARSGPPIR